MWTHSSLSLLNSNGHYHLYVFILVLENRFSSFQTWLSIFPCPRSPRIFSIIVGSARDKLIILGGQNFFHISIFLLVLGHWSSATMSRLWLEVTRLSFQSPARLKHILCRDLCLRLGTMNLPYQLKKISLYREDEVCPAKEQLCRVSRSHLSLC